LKREHGREKFVINIPRHLFSSYRTHDTRDDLTLVRGTCFMHVWENEAPRHDLKHIVQYFRAVALFSFLNQSRGREVAMGNLQPSSLPKPEEAYGYAETDWPWVWAIQDPEWLDWKSGLSENEIMAVMKQQQELPVRITDNLYLGNMDCALDIPLLRSKEITHVLNMAGNSALAKDHRWKQGRYNDAEIVYHSIDAEDEEGYPLLAKYLGEALEFISKSGNGENKSQVLVHCIAGQNRSACIVAAFLIKHHKMTVLEAVQHVRKQRGNVALSNHSFQEQLVALARQENLLGPAPGTMGSVVSQTPPPSDRRALWWDDARCEPNRHRTLLDRVT
jgi:protein-tyrosine phosphatase